MGRRKYIFNPFTNKLDTIDEASIATLTDVEIVNLQDCDVLVYHVDTQKWVNSGILGDINSILEFINGE